MSKKYYLVDFDGVVCDSRLECMVTSYIAYQYLNGEPYKPEYTKTEVPDKGAKIFIEYRYLARTAKEFMILWDMIVGGIDIHPDKILFEQVHVNQERLLKFNKLFYDTRYEWMIKDQKSWLNIHTVFGDMQDLLKKWLNEERAHIVSSKDQLSILTILQNNGVDIVEADISGCDEGDKPGHFKRLTKINKDKDIIMLDDNLENLEMAREYNIEGYLCTWGYTWDASIKEAIQKRFSTLSLEQLQILQ